MFNVSVDVNLMIENKVQSKNEMKINICANAKNQKNIVHTWNPSKCACECDKDWAIDE